MQEVRITTARGITLAGTLALPDGATPLDPDTLTTLVREGTTAPARAEAAVILAHDFLTDRHGYEHRLDQMAAAYRRAGFATLQFDFSGLGESDDDIITLTSEADDIRAACGWMTDLGFTRLGIHANGLGATAALLARPADADAVVAVGAVVSPQSILWENVFSPDQLDELDRHGLTRLPDDNANSRQWDVLSKQTLADVSLQDPATIMADLPWPVLLIHGALTQEFPDSTAGATEGFALLADGSQLVQIHEADAEAIQTQLATLGTQWMTRRLR